MRPLTLAWFGSVDLQDALQKALRGLGYQLRVTEGNTWLLADPLSKPTVLFLSRNNCPHEKLLSVLRKIDRSPTLGIVACDDPCWDEEILGHCNDFLGWPCHRDELELRLQRVFSEPGSQSCCDDDLSLVEEFVHFNLFGNSRTFVEAVKLVKKFARCDAPVLIEGETGTGKELAARAIHYLSARRDNPFIPVNCGAIPDDLLENELFGHERGAFTDAKDVQLGLVAQASGGTLFLDELDTLSVKAQVTLLRFLDDQEYKPLGGKSLQKADARVVAATNANLEELAQKGRFRRDLLFRLNVLSVHLPALRERADDIRLLAEHFIGEYSTRCNQSPKLLHPESLAWMRHYHWPGNVRELENLLQRELLLSDEPVIWIADKTVGAGTARKSTDGDKKLYSETSFREAKAHTIAAFEKCYLRWLMTETRGNISLAAKRAGKERSALRKLLQKHGIQRTTWSVTS